MKGSGAPMREVVSAELRSRSPIFMEGCQHYYYALFLSCGHEVERQPKYRPGGEVGWGRIWHGSKRSDILGHQKRARCEFCDA